MGTETCTPSEFSLIFIASCAVICATLCMFQALLLARILMVARVLGDDVVHMVKHSSKGSGASG